jgi:WD40 repeat protein
MSSLTSPLGGGAGAGGTSSSFSFPSTSQALSSSVLCSFALVKRVQLAVGGAGGSSSSSSSASVAINALDFNARGDHVVASTDEPDEGIYLYHTSTGQQKKQVFCKRSGSDLVRFTHHTNSVLVASKNKGWDGTFIAGHHTRTACPQPEPALVIAAQSRFTDCACLFLFFFFVDSIRYLSLHDNKYLRYFKGHRDRVCALSMAPRDDSFLSAAMDRTVRLWDLRTNVCQGLLHVPMPSPPSSSAASSSAAHKHLPAGGKVLVAHDPEGMVFAVATSPNIVKLYDRTYTHIPPRYSPAVLLCLCSQARSIKYVAVECMMQPSPTDPRRQQQTSAASANSRGMDGDASTRQ